MTPPDAFKERLRQRLRDQDKKIVAPSRHIASAVVVPLLYRSGDCHVLFTERSHQVRDHKGQIAFPGGCREAGDLDLLATALREAEEEVGLRACEVEILGCLNELLTPSGYHIKPFVGFVAEPGNYSFNRGEIASLLEIPLKHLRDPRYFRYENWELMGQPVCMPCFRYGQHLIWGATARITVELLELLSASE